MKKSKLLSTLSLASVMVLAGCGPTDTPACEHVDGNKDHICDLCNETVSDHEYAWVQVSDPTFEEEGLKKHLCSVCGAEDPATPAEPVAKKEHNYDLTRWVSLNAEKHWHPCTDEGYETFGTGEEVHTFGDILTDGEGEKDASYTEAGLGHQVCSKCGYIKQGVVIDQLQHHFSTTWSSDDTDHWHECTDEGYSGKTNATDVEPHNFGEPFDKVDATCTTAGSYKKTCLDCEKTVTFTTEALNHDYGEVNVSWEGDTATATRTCSHDASHTISEEKQGTYVKDTDATCTTNEKGHFEVTFKNTDFGYARTDANTYEKPNSMIEHTYGAEQVISAPDCTTAGSAKKVCDVCGHEDTYELPATGHVDLGKDHVCDVCGENLPWIESITLEYLTGYIGAGERVTLTAVVSGHNGATAKDVDWHITKSTGSTWTTYPNDTVDTIFELVDNKDGTATLIGKPNVYKAEYSVYVYATSAYDESVSSNKTEKIFYQTFNNTKRGTLNSYFGEGNWQYVPFFPNVDVKATGNTLTLKSNSTSGRTPAQMKNSFDNQGLWTKVDDGIYTLVDPNNSFIYYKAVITTSTTKSGRGDVTITKSFVTPSELIGAYSFVARDDYGNCDMPMLVNITTEGANVIAYASDGIYEHECSIVSIEEGTVSYSQGESYSDLKFSLEYGEGNVSVTSISGSWFDGSTWSASLPAALSADGLHNVTVNSAIENGTVTVTSTGGLSKAPAGAVIEFTTAADNGYELDEVTLSDTSVQLTALYGGKYRFVMPEGDVVINANFSVKEVAPTNWDTLSGDCGTLSTPLKINNGWGGTINLVLEFDNGTIVSYEKNNRQNTLTTMSSDTTGCTANQLHLTGSESNWNSLSYDFIIECNDGIVTLLSGSDKTVSTW